MIPTKLPPDWTLRESKDYPGRVYYYNKSTHESTWIRPNIYTHIYKSDPNFKWPPLVYVSHILVKHTESKNLETWKRNGVTRSKEEARQKILKIQEALAQGKVKFNDLAKQESEDVNTYEDDGVIGWIERGNSGFDQSFDDVAFSLGINKMCDEPVETSFGWHLILRLG